MVREKIYFQGFFGVGLKNLKTKKLTLNRPSRFIMIFLFFSRSYVFKWINFIQLIVSSFFWTYKTRD